MAVNHILFWGTVQKGNSRAKKERTRTQRNLSTPHPTPTQHPSFPCLELQASRAAQCVERLTTILTPKFYPLVFTILYNMSSFQWKFTKCACIHFPEAAVMNNHKLSGLKQQKWISLLFWKPEIHPYHWAEIKMSAGPPPLEGTLGEILFFASSSFWQQLPFLDLWWSHSVLPLVPSPSLLWDSWMDVTACILGNLLISKTRKEKKKKKIMDCRDKTDMRSRLRYDTDVGMIRQGI